MKLVHFTVPRIGWTIIDKAFPDHCFYGNSFNNFLKLNESLGKHQTLTLGSNHNQLFVIISFLSSL